MARPKDLKSHTLAAPELNQLSAPRFAGVWAAVTYAVATMCLAYPALTGAFLVNVRSDQYKIGYAFRQFAAEWLKSGQGFPQWNPFLFGGLPYVAAMHGDIFYPTFLLRMIMPTDAAMTWEFAIHLFLAGLFTYAFLRAWGFGFFGALIGGLAYMLSGQIASLASPGHDGKLFVSALFPLALWMLVRGMRDGRVWAWGALAVAIGLAVLSPHPQLLQYMLLGSGAFALYLAFAEYPGSGRLPRDVAVKRLGFALGAVLLGGLIGAVQFFPVREYVPFSPRAGGRGYDYATSFSMPIEEILNVYLPQFTGILDRYWGRNNIHFHSEYLGAAVLVLAGAAFGRTARRSFRRFWLVTGIVALIWALGGNTPFYHIVYAIVPGSHYFRAPSTIFFIVSFSVAVLAAIGTERVLAGAVGKRYVIGWAGAAAVIALLLSVGGYDGLVDAISASMNTGYPAEQHAMLGHMNASNAILGAWRSFVAVAFTTALIWAATTEWLPRRSVGWALAAVVLLDLWSIERTYWEFSPPAAKLYASDPAIDYVVKAQAKDPGRVIVLPLSQISGFVPGDPTLTGCSGGTGGPTLMVHHVRNVTGCHGNEPGRVQQLGGFSDTTPQYDVGRFLTPAGLHHENIHFLLTNAPDTVMRTIEAQLHQQPFAPVLGPVKTASGSTVYLYRVPGSNPLAWVASAIAKAPAEQVLPTLFDPRFNPLTVALADTDTKLPTVQLQALPAAATQSVTVTHYSPGSIGLALDQPSVAGQALVVSENYFTGWRATVDGKPTPVARVNFNLMGVALPNGGRTVELRFEDHAYEVGKAVTLAALLLSLALWIGGAVYERRRPTFATAA